MQLLFSDRSPLNTTICLPSGQVLYKIETPWAFSHNTSIIYRVVPNSESKGDSQDQYVEIGRILHKAFARSIFTFNGIEMPSSEFFDGRAHGRKTWEAADGRRYMWKIKLKNQTLHLADTKDQVAIVNVPKFRALRNNDKKQVTLGVAEECRGILDEIVFTLVHVENIRRTKRRIAIMAAVAGGASAG